jgi:hypothetical protein
MEKNSGPGPCRNEVIYRGEGEWITWMDDDDFFTRNPLEDIGAFKSEADIIRSDVYDANNYICVPFESYTNPVFGSIFKRKFLEKTNLIFIPELGIAGSEDSVFLVFSCAMSEKTIRTSSFIQHEYRDNSNYTLSSASLEEDYAISLISICNFCYMTKYKDHIKNYEIIWKSFEKYFSELFELYTKEDNTPLKNYYLLTSCQIFFKFVLEILPESKNIKPYIGTNNPFLPYIYYAYHYCKLDGDSLYTLYDKNDIKINSDNFLRILTYPHSITMMHFPTVYKGVIEYPCKNMVKRGRKNHGYPEKYWQ